MFDSDSLSKTIAVLAVVRPDLDEATVNLVIRTYCAIATPTTKRRDPAIVVRNVAVEPEPVVAVEPEPAVAVEPEPAVAVEPEPAVAVEPEPAQETERFALGSDEWWALAGAKTKPMVVAVRSVLRAGTWDGFMDATTSFMVKRQRAAKMLAWKPITRDPAVTAEHAAEARAVIVESKERAINGIRETERHPETDTMFEKIENLWNDMNRRIKPETLFGTVLPARRPGCLSLMRIWDSEEAHALEVNDAGERSRDNAFYKNTSVLRFGNHKMSASLGVQTFSLDAAEPTPVYAVVCGADRIRRAREFLCTYESGSYLFNYNPRSGDRGPRLRSEAAALKITRGVCVNRIIRHWWATKGRALGNPRDQVALAYAMGHTVGMAVATYAEAVAPNPFASDDDSE